METKTRNDLTRSKYIQYVMCTDARGNSVRTDTRGEKTDKELKEYTRNRESLKKLISVLNELKLTPAQLEKAFHLLRHDKQHGYTIRESATIREYINITNK